MTEINVVQLARFNATDFASNTEWTTTLKQPIILNQSDTAVVSKAYLDSRLNSSGNIIIPIDTVLTLQYYFYYMFPPDGASTTLANPDTTTYPLNQIVKNNNAWTDMNPIDDCLFATRLQDINATLSPLEPTIHCELWQGNIDLDPPNDDLRGAPQPPYKNFDEWQGNPYPNDPTPKSGVTINQSQAGQFPLLLTTIAPFAVDSKPFKKQWQYTLKAGSYSNDELAEIITREMSKIQTNQPPVSSYTPDQQFGATEIPANLNAFLAKGSQIVVVDLVNTNAGPFPGSIQDPPWYLEGIARYSDRVVQRNGMKFVSNIATDPITPVTQQLCVFSEFLTDTRIPPNLMANYLRQTAGNPENPLCFIPSKYQAQMTFPNYFQSESPPVWGGHAVLEYTTPVVGVNTPELQYNDQAGIFQFAYLHTPLLQLPTTGKANTGESNPIEVVKLIKAINFNFYEVPPPPANVFWNATDSGVKITEHTKHSGIIFHSMEPKSFWQDILGFDVPNITFNDSQVYGPNNIMTYELFNKVTTSGYVGLNQNFSLIDNGTVSINQNQPAYTTPFPFDAVYQPTGNAESTYTNLLNSARWQWEHYLCKNPYPLFFQNNNGAVIQNAMSWDNIFANYYEEYSSALVSTNPLQAVSPPLSSISNVGHFLIEIVAYGGDKEFINNETVYQVKSILSSYYSSPNEFLTSPFPDSYVYTHTGETQVIHSFKVRIIDPFTMETAKNLGPSSSIYLQFNKALNKISLQQPT
jgi:hypothetical protein